jgi:hypothetical protein
VRAQSKWDDPFCGLASARLNRLKLEQVTNTSYIIRKEITVSVHPPSLPGSEMLTVLHW